MCPSWSSTDWISREHLQPIKSRGLSCADPVSQWSWQGPKIPFLCVRSSSEVLLGSEERMVILGWVGHQVSWCVSHCGQGKGRAQRLETMPENKDGTAFLDFRVCFRTHHLDLLFLPSVSPLCTDPKIKQIKRKLLCFASLFFPSFSLDVFCLLYPSFSLYVYLKTITTKTDR